MQETPPDSVEPPAAAVVFRGSKRLAFEASLVLEAKAISHEVIERDAAWLVAVPAPLALKAYDELDRYGAERRIAAPVLPRTVPFSGAVYGATAYVLVLLSTAYCAGAGALGLDWFARGSLEAGAGTQWWRALTALTLHLDQEHLLSNLLFGLVAGVAASRLLGPGIAWASIVGAAFCGNLLEMLIAPPAYRAVGASSAVFAALGLLSGLAWRQRLSLRERRWYRWAPLIAGICLLTLLGAGTAHVDVLGHALGFVFGTALGWLHARVPVPRGRAWSVQAAYGLGVILLIGGAWLAALRAAS